MHIIVVCLGHLGINISLSPFQVGAYGKGVFFHDSLFNLAAALSFVNESDIWTFVNTTYLSSFTAISSVYVVICALTVSWIS